MLFDGSTPHTRSGFPLLLRRMHTAPSLSRTPVRHRAVHAAPDAGIAGTTTHHPSGNDRRYDCTLLIAAPPRTPIGSSFAAPGPHPSCISGRLAQGKVALGARPESCEAPGESTYGFTGWPMSRPGASPILIAGSAQPSCRTLRDRRKELTSEGACQSAITDAGHKSMGGARLRAPHTQGPHTQIAFWRWRAGLGGGPKRRPPNTAGLGRIQSLSAVASSVVDDRESSPLCLPSAGAAEVVLARA
ncbi:hypothetical protein HETIRDRAFT_105939 [Heterobasidion irregulare TC 32-1]|uniref:Uncharacterized protein n=1 Tax=Heterobasidion irregulare (strain TC 32-1) TaxID=747525 RepID=W4JSD0_HETIT|nr:uncharacterized protein HETIRDRAFT_105939 [Heterobasidion irregulare TC 32-1]ETW76472.1 hypothetical protein HETIRDRAFT_105939 [Heterobasidion irregulare TC 32-1]